MPHIGSQMFKGSIIFMLMLIIGISVPGVILEIGLLLRIWDFWQTVAYTSVTASVSGIFIMLFWNNISASLHGKQVFTATFWRSPTDHEFYFAVLKKPPELISDEPNGKETKFEYRLWFENVDEEFEQILLRTEKPFNEVFPAFGQETIFFKGMPVKASVAPASFVIVGDSKDENGNTIPICVPLDAGYNVKLIQENAKFFNISREEVNQMKVDFDSYLSIKLKEQNEILLKENESIKDLARKALGSAAKIARHYLDLEKTSGEKPRKIPLPRISKRLIIFIAIVIGSVLFYLWILGILGW